MLIRGGSCLHLLVLSSGLCVASSAAGQTSPAAPIQQTQQPEIVRVRIVEGDVRIARGKAVAKQTGDTWEQAVADLPLESGFNLTTGNGRAEIEFEDASTLYLGENSALSFDDLHTTNGIPHTEMLLLTGTATLHLQPSVAGETFVLRTLTDRIRVTYPEKIYERVSGYLDAVAITRLSEPSVGPAEGAAGAQPAPVLTVFHKNGKVVEHDGKSDSTEFAAFDAWVADRVEQHEAAAAEVAQESGLPASTPGLADMNDEGVFFKCEPYGVCWAPNDAAADQQQAQMGPAPVGAGPEFQPRLRPSKVGIYAGDRVATNLTAASLLGFSDQIDVSTALPQGFTCLTMCEGQMFPGQLLTMQFGSAPDVPLGKYEVAVTLNSGLLTHLVYLTIHVGPVIDDDYVPVDFGGDLGGGFPCTPRGPHLPVRAPRGLRYGGAPGYAWGVCHSGTWIYRQHRYVWVVGQKKHHRPPLRPIGCHGKLCYVPIHPHDEKGKLPLNLKYTVFRPIDRKGTGFEAVTLRPKDKVEMLAEPAKEYLNPVPVRLAKADAPKLQAHDAPVATVASAASTKAAATSGTTEVKAATGDLAVATTVTSASTVDVDDLYFDGATDTFFLTHMVPGMGGGSGGQMVRETVEEHRESMRPVVAGGVAGAHATASSGAHGTVVHAGGSVSHASSGATHASSGGSHVSSGASAGGGSHSAPPPPPPPPPSSHH